MVPPEIVEPIVAEYGAFGILLLYIWYDIRVVKKKLNKMDKKISTNKTIAESNRNRIRGQHSDD